jgi:hypothetical protein
MASVARMRVNVCFGSRAAFLTSSRHGRCTSDSCRHVATPQSAALSEMQAHALQQAMLLLDDIDSAGERWCEMVGSAHCGLEVGTLPADRSALRLYDFVDIVLASPRAFPKIDIGVYQPAVIDVFRSP